MQKSILNLLKIFDYNWRLIVPEGIIPVGFVPENYSPDGNLKYLKGGEAIGVAGQGDARFPNADPDKNFDVHYLTSLGNTWYDPSYGSRKITNGDANLRAKAYENQAIGWYGKMLADLDLWFKKNDLGGASEITWGETE
ncbi:hypothetical protein OAG53_01615 [Akkermansiaceae bacterium]|nr:hypothetical protein [Akkermansiaceae bacterium]